MPKTWNFDGKLGDFIRKKAYVKNSLDDPNREIVENSLCEQHDEIIIYRPSVDRSNKIGMIEIKKCKCGCWRNKL